MKKIILLILFVINTLTLVAQTKWKSLYTDGKKAQGLKLKIDHPSDWEVINGTSPILNASFRKIEINDVIVQVLIMVMIEPKFTSKDIEELHTYSGVIKLLPKTALYINHSCNNYISGIKASYIDFIGDEYRNGVRLKVRTRNYWLVYKDKYVISIAFGVNYPNEISSNILE
jgi:hypothetical protein